MEITPIEREFMAIWPEIKRRAAKRGVVKPEINELLKQPSVKSLCPLPMRFAKSVPIDQPHHYDQVGSKRVRRPGRRVRPTAAPTSHTQIYRLAPTDDLTERVDVGRIVDLGVDSATMWKYFAVATYGKDHVADYAIREAFQNARDAVDRSGRPGEIVFGIQTNNKCAVLMDNGVGMSADTLANKFFVLGKSGKTGEEQSVGGFGVAKAVILSLADIEQGGNWSILTNDLTVDSQEIGKVTGFRKAEYATQGTRIFWNDLDDDTVSKLQSDWGAVQWMAWSQWNPRTTVWFAKMASGVKTQMIPLKPRGKILASRTFGKTKVTIRPIDVQAENKKRGAEMVTLHSRRTVCVRLNGLAQLWEYANAPGNYIVDVETTARPGEPDYPFDPHRMNVNRDVQDFINETLEPLASEKLSGTGRDVKAHEMCYLRKLRSIDSDEVNRFSGYLETFQQMMRKLPDYAKKADNLIVRASGGKPRATKTFYQSLGGNWDAPMHQWRLTIRSAPGTEPLTEMREIAHAFTAPATRVKGEFVEGYELRPDDVKNLMIATYVTSAVCARLSGSTEVVPVYGLWQRKDKAHAEFRVHQGRFSVGYDLADMRNCRSKDQLKAYFNAVVWHELTHSTMKYHDETFTAYMAEMMMDGHGVLEEVWKDVDRLWDVWQGKEAPAQRPARPPKNTKARPQPTQDATLRMQF